VPLFLSHLQALLHSVLEAHPAATKPLLATLSLVRAHFEKTHRAELANTTGAPSNGRSSGWSLTPREIEVATWLTQAKANPEIAIILGMSRRTVEKHVEHILEKLGVENRTAAALLIGQTIKP
jgi:DNA-binding CsgD family transcriptional regulator